MKVGDNYTIHCYKHDGHIYNSYEYSVLLDIKKDYLVFGNNKVKVMEEDGRTWYTKEPAIIFYFKDKWYNVIVQFKKNDIYYYCNIASPTIIEGKVIKYIDYDLDVKIFTDGEKRLFDVEEYERHKRKMNYSDDLDYILKEHVKILVDWINNGRGPFSEAYVNIWYKRYVELKNR